MFIDPWFDRKVSPGSEGLFAEKVGGKYGRFLENTGKMGYLVPV
ncbi:MAG: hypothetical protein ACLQBD_16530 [Syntrophobacteraceae bacterium]